MSSYPRLRKKQEQEDLVNLHTWKALECAKLRNHTSKDRVLKIHKRNTNMSVCEKIFCTNLLYNKGLANVILAF